MLPRDYRFNPLPTPERNTDSETASSHELVCHRTQCAIRILLLPIPRWRRFAEGLDPTEGAHEQVAVNGKLEEILKQYLNAARQKMNHLGQLKMQKRGAGLDEQEWQDALAGLKERWRQIEEVLDQGCQVLQSAIERE